jgi:DNA-binding transcriptional MerR regulator
MEGIEALTVANAARHAGVSTSTIRRWMDGGNLEFRTTSQGHRTTSKEALMRCLSQHSHAPHRTVRGATTRRSHDGVMEGSHDTVTVGAMRGSTVQGEGGTEALCIALEALAHERRVAEDLRTQNRDLQGQLVKLAAEMQAVLSKETDGKLSRWFRR